MNVCLVSLPSPFLIDQYVFPPLGILSVGKGLKKQGFHVRVHDGPINEIPEGFDFYGIGATTPQYHLAIEALTKIRSFSSKPQVYIGGPHATVDPDSCKRLFDGVVIGAGDVGLGIAVHNQCKMIEADQSYIVTPDRSLIDIHKYKYYIDGIPATSIMTSRGCPFNCHFCCKVMKKFLLPSELVLRELSKIRYVYRYKAVMFFDDLFVYDVGRLHEILDGMKGFDMIWRCFVRGDIVVRNGNDVLKKMKDIGCREVGIGVESGDDGILKKINKGENSETIQRAISMLKEEGIRVKGFFIVGLPGESPETIENTRNFIRNSGLDDVDFTIYTPYKGSDIYENRQRYDISWDKLEIEKMWYKGKPGDYDSLVWTSMMSREDIVKARDNLESEFKK